MTTDLTRRVTRLEALTAARDGGDGLIECELSAEARELLAETLAGLVPDYEPPRRVRCPKGELSPAALEQLAATVRHLR